MSAALPLQFTENELDLLARTADAMSAYMGKPVLAEVIVEDDIGAECVIFAVPLQPGDEDEDCVKVSLGGPDARYLGNRGGLPLDADALECEFLWAIQLANVGDIRFIKLDRDGEEVAWVAELSEILPFGLSEPLMQTDSDDEDEDEDAGQRADDDSPPAFTLQGGSRTLH